MKPGTEVETPDPDTPSSNQQPTKINYKTRETATFWAARNGQQRHCCRVGARDPVTSLEQLLAELTSEAAADASDKPCVLCHLGPFA
jgi:hypothetical protein